GAEVHPGLGMTRALYDRVAGAVTVHSLARRPDARLAPPLVQTALRGGGGATEALPLELLARPLNRDAQPEAQTAAGDDPNVTVLYLGPSAHRSRARTFTIHAEARTASGGWFARRAVVRMGGRGTAPYQILAWGRGRSRLFPASAP
ncbi:MAG: hypothetical protein R3229_14425, partial [Alphaproteobacteria bacterium]|nr:hypothetical protein [Alphaproteobacteria bacterium]